MRIYEEFHADWADIADNDGDWKIKYRITTFDDGKKIRVMLYHEAGDHKSDKWAFLCNKFVFRRMVLWYIWHWVRDEWCGLRREKS